MTGRRLDGKTAFITGVSPNIMGGIAEELSREGAAVAVVDLTAEYVQACAHYIQHGGGTAMAMVCDVTNEDAVRQAVSSVIERFGTIDILVNGAAFQNRKGLLSMTVDEWKRQIDTILTGTFLVTKHIANAMVKTGKGGSIINICSTEGHQGIPGNIAYATAKAGLLHFTRCAAMELAPYKIRVNSVTPTATGVSDGLDRARRWGVTWRRPSGIDAVTDEEYEALLESRRKMLPLQELPTPADYGKAVVFLASDDARMITGFDLRVDAGAVVRYWGWIPST
jgi:NAD(P)-dependent dehydrogenase (short-subunit alcohol dehydrogenase family)